VASFHTPCKSGSPQGVRPGVDAFLADFGLPAGFALLVWPTSGAGASHAKTASAANDVADRLVI